MIFTHMYKIVNNSVIFFKKNFFLYSRSSEDTEDTPAEDVLADIFVFIFKPQNIKSLF